MKAREYIYRFTQDVGGEAYERLVEIFLESCDTFSLVWRDAKNHPSADDPVHTGLSHLQVKHRKSKRWPGTRIFRGQASLITYKAAESALPVLLQPGSLFSWLQPHYPEDLWGTSERDGLLLATVSHEREGWVMSPSFARAIGQFATLERERRELGDDAWFERAK